MLLVVPRVFEKVYEGAMAKATKGGKFNKALFERSTDIAVRWSQAKVEGRVPVKLAAQYALYDKLVYSKLRAALGGSYATLSPEAVRWASASRTSSTRWVCRSSRATV